MGIDSITGFVDAVRQSRLLEPATVDELARRAPERFTDPRTLAHHLIQKGRLTAYQVNQLFQGQGNTLVLGNYILLERLGEGGMGQVFKARHRSMGRVVALKVIRRDRLENADAVKRFRREIQAVAQLHHPNVVLAFDADAVGNTHFFVMEFVEGIDLSQLVKQKGALPVGTACDFIRQAALGLQHAHQKGMVHRDIKPSNLLVTGNGEQGTGKQNESGSPLVKILDMGLARLAPHDTEDNSGASLSQDGAVIGTPDFMAPEQAKNSSKVDARADIYSLGCSLYYLLTRQPPFVGGSNIEKLLKHQMDAPRPVEEIRSDVPQAVRSLLLRMMAKRPEERVQTAAEVASALAPFCNPGGAFRAVPSTNGGNTDLTATMPLAAASTTATTPAGRIAERLNLKLPVYRQLARKHWRGLAIAGAAVLLLGIGLLMVRAMFGGSGKPRTTGPLASAKLPFTPREPNSTKRSEPVVMGHKYLPDDTGMVVTLNLAQLFKSPVVTDAVRDRLEIDPILMGMKGVLGAVGIELFRDVQRLTLALSPAEPADKSCFVFYGTFNPEKFSNAAGRNASRSHAVQGMPNARIYEYPDQSARRPMYFGLVSPTAAVFSSEKEHVAHCFRRAAGQRIPNLSDAPVQTLIQNLDAKPTLYVVFGSTFLNKSQGFRRENPVRAIRGGLRFSDAVAAEVVVTATSSEGLDKLRLARFLIQGLLGSNELVGPFVSQLVREEPVVNKSDLTLTLRHSFSADEFRRMLLQKKP